MKKRRSVVQTIVFLLLSDYASMEGGQLVSGILLGIGLGLSGL